MVLRLPVHTTVSHTRECHFLLDLSGPRSLRAHVVWHRRKTQASVPSASSLGGLTVGSGWVRAGSLSFFLRLGGKEGAMESQAVALLGFLGSYPE